MRTVITFKLIKYFYMYILL